MMGIPEWVATLAIIGGVAISVVLIGAIRAWGYRDGRREGLREGARKAKAPGIPGRRR